MPPWTKLTKKFQQTRCELKATFNCILCFIQVPSLCEDLLSSVDQPLKIARDKATGKDYLLCDYNRDGDSYRYLIC